MGKRKKKRNPNGAGSIWRKPDGRYGVAVPYSYYDPDTGRTRRKKKETTKPDWRSAHEWKVAVQRDLLGGAVMGGEDPYVSDYLSEWLEGVVAVGRAESTYAKREYHVRVYLSPAFAGVRLGNLEPRQIHEFYVRLARSELAPVTRRDIHSTLKTALNQAVKWGMLPRNPVGMVDAPRVEATATEDEEIRTLSDEQARRLFAATEGERWHYYYVAAIRTGLRPGELLGLQWGDLELSEDPGSLRVRRSLGVRKGGGAYLKPPKSAASRRALALHWEAVDAFAAQKAQLVAEGLSAGKGDLVFPNTRGNPMSRNNLLGRNLRPDLQRAGLPPLTLHELRHTFASIMIYEWEVGVAVVSKMLGHANVSFTMDVYGHLLPDAQQSAIRALAKLHRRPKTGGFEAS